MAHEKLPVFLFECLLAMVLLLVGDVFPHLPNVGLGNGEGTVTGLPCEFSRPAFLFLNPFGRRFFNIFHGLTDRNGSGEIEEKMYVVIDRVDDDRMAAEIPEDGRHVGMQGVADRVGDKGFAVLCAENQMNMETSE